MSPRATRLTLGVAAPLLALLAAFAITSLVLLVAGDPVGQVWSIILAVPETRNVANIVNSATVLYLSGLAVAVGFRMNLFNIGVDGQYRVAAFVAAVVAGEGWLPGPLNIVLTVAAAVLVGAAWAGIAGVLRATRGVSEVISTIMLNFISTSLVAYFLRRVAVREEGSNIVATRTVPEGSRIPGIPLGSGPGAEVYGFVVVAVLAGVGYWLLVNRTRFGFDLRATGMSPSAATASGVDARRMVVKAMLISGAIAGLVGLPDLLGDTYHFGTEFTAGLGFLGIAVALLGRGSPTGIAFAALLFAFLDRAAVPLQFADIPASVVTIIQGTIVLSVVVANELTRQLTRRRAERGSGQADPAADDGTSAGPGGPIGTRITDDRQGAQS